MKYKRVYYENAPQHTKHKRYKKHKKSKVSGKSEEDKAMSEGIDFMMKGVALSIELLFKMIYGLINGVIKGVKYIIEKRKQK